MEQKELRHFRVVEGSERPFKGNRSGGVKTIATVEANFTLGQMNSALQRRSGITVRALPSKTTLPEAYDLCTEVVCISADDLKAILQALDLNLEQTSSRLRSQKQAKQPSRRSPRRDNPRRDKQFSHVPGHMRNGYN